jgi:hypothetical protein
MGDGWSMELGIVHRSKQHVLTVGEAAQAGRGRGNAQAARTSHGVMKNGWVNSTIAAK